MKPALAIHDIPKWHQWIIFSLQHLFAMFGSTILVPALTGLDPAVALVSSGVGTLAFILITRGSVPAYLGSSFAFIYPITQAIDASGIGGAMIGSFFAGLSYGVIAIAIRLGGMKGIIRLLPPIVVGPVIIVIGLALAPTAVDMAMNAPDTGEYSTKYFIVALVTLAITVAASIFLRGFLGLIPVLIGIVGGYVFALTQGIVDTSGVQAAWNQIVTADSVGAFFSGIFHVPNFTVPFVDYNVADVFSWQLFFTMVPIAVVTVSEHIGHQLALSKIVDKNMLVKPGLDKSITGDGVATIIASMLGGPPNTTYGENIGVLAITRIFSVYVIGGTAVLACEDDSLVPGGVMHEGTASKRLGLPGINNVSESVHIARDVLLAEAAGCHYHICHVSTKESVRVIRDAKRAGIQVTAEVTPHHLLLTDEDIKHDDGNFKMNPPLRSEADRQALIEGLLDGTIDMIATDHAPHTAEEKNVSMLDASFGIVGSETAFSLLYTQFVETGIFTLRQLIDWLTIKPAQAFELPYGRFEAGAAADLTVLDLQADGLVDPTLFQSKGTNTPFIGWRYTGEPTMTICNGEIVYRKEAVK
ncbi:dihydroorotase [Terribacillus halophilus]|uniref:dihydroorotase n=1 Tax=Terribacillus halophilus TaxID=361279 RepID=UPI0009858844|nr:dihydroorotase [Terribacillus halophilus]